MLVLYRKFYLDKILCCEFIFLVLEKQWIIELKQRMVQSKVDVRLVSDGSCKLSCI